MCQVRSDQQEVVHQAEKHPVGRHRALGVPLHADEDSAASAKGLRPPCVCSTRHWRGWGLAGRAELRRPHLGPARHRPRASRSQGAEGGESSEGSGGSSYPSRWIPGSTLLSMSP